MTTETPHKAASGRTQRPEHPTRIQMSRQHPWRAQHPDAVRVDRATQWGNPWRIGDAYPWADYHPMTAEDTVRLFRYTFDTQPGRALIRRELAGKDLACWCKPDQPCHADVLLEIANLWAYSPV